MLNNLRLLSTAFLPEYLQQVAVDFNNVLFSSTTTNSSAEDFDYYFAASSLYSSKIEGNTLDANSFIRNRGSKVFPKKKELQEIEHLISAYELARTCDFTKHNFFKAHKLLSATLVAAKQRGAIRLAPIAVVDTSSLKPVYMAVEPELADAELNKLFADIALLQSTSLSVAETFYYASLVHLWIAMIHPFADGNGRAARLAEKWFLARKLGEQAWIIQSEKYYWDHRPDYYRNIALGFNYYAIKWERCLPFLLMLPQAYTNTSLQNQ